MRKGYCYTVGHSVGLTFFCTNLMLPSLLLLEVPQSLLLRTKQLMLRVDLLLLAKRHCAQLAQSQLHPFPQLKTTEKYTINIVIIII